MKSNSNSGFTLLENLIIILIIGILAGIVAPVWLSILQNMRLNTAQSQLYQAIRQAQSQAKTKKSTWQVSFREQNDTLQWAVHPEAIESTNVAWNNIDSNVRLDTETTLRQSDSIRYVQFDYLGSIRKPPLGRITISSKSGGKSKRCVFISTILGALRTAKENPTPENDKYCY
ncbi:prepilin-type N-terminal cleavage/methylation domain-containing protein [Okeanomitos corallinicola TIOX110]|uniref:Prepilin-type N-terminal cleavage/methylation domain-containing protein n=1 Tax=Okeanomitos corallinicola TIOX110 TaxID=3133117 RepID=A0ABZ2UW46_9CYAN